MSITGSSAFVGTNVVNILSQLVLGFESNQKGLIHTIPQKYNKIYMPRLDTAANQLQARVDTPSTSATSVYSERVIDPKDMMFYMEFNPKTFESKWRDFWPKGAMVNQIQDSKVQQAVIRTVRGSLNNQLERLVWQGDTAGAADLAFFDGFLKTMAADGDVIKVTTPAAPITKATIKEILDSMITACPDAVKVLKSPKFVMSHKVFNIFSEMVTELQYKGNDVFDATTARYRGFTIITTAGMTDTQILLGNFTSGPEGNLFAGTWMDNDRENFKIERLQNNSELWFLKAVFRYGVQYGYGNEIVMYNPA